MDDLFVYDNLMLKNSNIPPIYVRIISHQLGLNHKNIHKLLTGTQLITDDLLNDSKFINPAQFIQIFSNALELTQQPDLGLKLGKNLTLTTHGAVGFLVNSSPNLKVALEAFQSFFKTRISFATLELSYTSSSVIATLNFDLKIPHEVERMITEACVVSFYQCVEYIIGPNKLRKIKTSFKHHRPDYAKAYEDYLASNFEFSSANTFTEIPLELCDIPNVTANQETFLMAMQQCQSMLQKLEGRKNTYSARVQHVILSKQLKNISEQTVSAALFISPRTLSRKLSEENTDFRTIKEQILAQQAEYYLTQTNLSIEVIATLLNYSDGSNFRRAFKKWFGVLPHQFRLNLPNKKG